MTIDTKSSREIRAAGTRGEWACCEFSFNHRAIETPSDEFDVISTRENLELIAHAVNQLVPMADEIDRLRAESEALKRATSPRPMSEAPRDGTSVLVCAGSKWITVHWFGSWLENEESTYRDNELTAWLPLPPEPEEPT